MALRKAGFAALGLIFTGSPCFASTLRVPSEYASIQAGIDAAAEGDTVLVAAGTYGGLVHRMVDIGFGPRLEYFLVHLKSGVTVRSEQGPGATFLDVSGESFENFAHYVICGISSNTSIEGFSFQGGEPYLFGLYVRQSDPVRIVDCSFVEFNGGDECGAAATVSESNVEFRDTSFFRCHSDCGAAAIENGSSKLKMIGCHVEGCYGGTDPYPAVTCFADAGIPGFSLLFQDCVFVGNVSDGNGGALFTDLDNIAYEQIVERCIFIDNVGGLGGAAALSGNNSVVRESIFIRNRATCISCSAGALAGGHNFEVTGCVFWGNSNVSPTIGGSAFTAGNNVRLERNIFSNNTGGEAVRVFSFAPSSGCNVYWENPGGAIEGAAPLPTDIFLDPQFCDPASEDFTLQATSPCLPENNDGCGQIGAYGLGCGSVHVESKSWGGIKALFRSDPSSR